MAKPDQFKIFKLKISHFGIRVVKSLRKSVKCGDYFQTYKTYIAKLEFIKR